MRSALYFSIGVFLAFCLFWPVNALAIYCPSLPLYNGVKPAGTLVNTYSGLSGGEQFSATVSSQVTEQCCGISFTFPGTSSGTIYYPGGSVASCTPGVTQSCTRQSYTALTSCPAGPPAHCTDGQMNEGETGIDCGGGGCTSECTQYCPTNTEYWGNAANGEMECWQVLGTDLYGNCPQGFNGFTVQSCPPAGCPSGVSAGGRGCYRDYPSVYAASLVLVPDAQLLGGFSVMQSTNNTTTDGAGNTVDNGDGTSTTTQTSTTTNSDGSTSTTTTTTTKNNTTGAVVGTSTSTTSQGTVEDNPANYNFGVTDTPSDGLIPDGIVPTENDFEGFVDNAISNNAVSGILADSGITTSAPVCSVSAPVFGTTFTLDFCNQQITDFLEFLGTMIVGFAYIVALFIVFA